MRIVLNLEMRKTDSIKMDTCYLGLLSGDPNVLTCSPAGDFTIQIGTAMSHKGDCAAYLLEATIPFTWNNISGLDILLVKVKAKETLIILTPAYYTSIPTLEAAIN